MVWLQVDSGETQSQYRFCTIPFSMISTSTTYNSSASQAATHLPSTTWRKYCPWIFKLLSIALGLSHNFLHNVLIKQLFKYIYSISKALNTVVRSANSSKSFSLSNAIVHVLPQKIVTNAVSPTPRLLSTTRNNASIFLLTDIIITAFIYVWKLTIIGF